HVETPAKCLRVAQADAENANRRLTPPARQEPRMLESALRELRSTASAAEAVLLPLLHAGVAGEVARIAELLDHAAGDIGRFWRSGGCRGSRAWDKRSSNRLRHDGSGRLHRNRLRLLAFFVLIPIRLDHRRIVERLWLLLALGAEHRLQCAGQSLRNG